MSAPRVFGYVVQRDGETFCENDVPSLFQGAVRATKFAQAFGGVAVPLVSKIMHDAETAKLRALLVEARGIVDTAHQVDSLAYKTYADVTAWHERRRAWLAALAETEGV